MWLAGLPGAVPLWQVEQGCVTLLWSNRAGDHAIVE